MGYKFYAGKVTCPLFSGVVQTNNGQVCAVQCQDMSENLGFDVRIMMRLKNTGELKEYMELFCEDCYEACPYYKIWNQKEA